VRKHQAPPAVLIVDEDLGFVGWLGELFSEAGYQALPALNCRAAVSLIKQFKLDVDVIAIDARLPGARGIIELLKHAHRPLKIVAILDPGGEWPADIPRHATLDRPSGWEPVSRPDWMKKILRVLKQAEAKAAG
jgi:hypothetical protein